MRLIRSSRGGRWWLPIAFSLTLIAGFVLALRLLGVRDWRCYAAAFAAMPLASSIMIGTLSASLTMP